MVVLLKEDNIPPQVWKLGVIQEVHPGSDKLVRVATVKSKGGTFRRSVAKLIPLPQEH